jgi:hypothetical protein
VLYQGKIFYPIFVNFELFGALGMQAFASHLALAAALWP